MITYLLILLLSVNYVSDKMETNKVFYKKGEKITWKDFKVKNLNDASAKTETAISYDYSSDGKVDVYCILYKDFSYVKTNSRSAYLLNHEQRHFDITYLYAMKFTNYLKKNPNLTENQISIIYDRIIKQWEEEQDRYDSETEHSMNSCKQMEWDSSIDNKLTNL